MWESWAIWPLECYPYDNGKTTDTHSTEEAAQAVADMLKRYGFGGDGKYFPLETGITHLEEKVKNSHN